MNLKKAARPRSRHRNAESIRGTGGNATSEREKAECVPACTARDLLDELELTALLRPYGVIIPGGTPLLTTELISIDDKHVVPI